MWAAIKRVMGIEPTPSAWKAEVLPLNYTREPNDRTQKTKKMINNQRLCPFSISCDLSSDLIYLEGGGFEPPKAEPPDLQSGPFDRSGTPP